MEYQALCSLKVMPMINSIMRMESCLLLQQGMTEAQLSVGPPRAYTCNLFCMLREVKRLTTHSLIFANNTVYIYRYSSVISVAAIDESKNVASFSQQNSQVELAAPGVGVWSTLPNNQYAAWDGTSMACPHVSAVAALIWSFYPQETPQRIREAMIATAEDLGPSGWDPAYGFGLVQAAAALQCLEDGLCFSGTSPLPTTSQTNPTPTDCVDNPSGWVDSGGDGCDFYSTQECCNLYGSNYTNNGKTAQDACCTCGGGTSEDCVDDPLGWTDSVGDGCDWYGVDNRCEVYSSEIGTDGKTPLEACCVCQGVPALAGALSKNGDTETPTSNAAGGFYSTTIASILSSFIVLVTALVHSV